MIEKLWSNSTMIILFDGACGMCNWFLVFVDKHSSNLSKQIQATPSPTRFCEMVGVLEYVAVEQLRNKTIIVSQNGVIILRSRAVSKILASTKNKPLEIVAFLITLVPQRMADLGYSLIAKVRRRILPKTNACALYTFKYINIIE